MRTVINLVGDVEETPHFGTSNQPLSKEALMGICYWKLLITGKETSVTPGHTFLSKDSIVALNKQNVEKQKLIT